MASNALSVINKVKYSGLDFDTHFDDLRARLQVKFAAEFNDFALSSLGILLIDLSSFGLDTLSFYLDRRATEAYLDTARTRSAVARLTRQLGYKMGPATASSVDLQVNVVAPQVFPIPIQKGFQFKGPNGLIFEAAETVTFSIGAGPSTVLTVPVYEGETVVETFTSNGAANQEYALRRVPTDKSVALGTVKVTVDSAAWAENKFLSIDASNQFEVGYNDDPPTVKFGDAIAGNIPPNTSTIRVQYVASRGKTGQVSSGTIQDVNSPLIVNFTTISLKINNQDRSVGGDDPETIDKAKINAGRVFKSRQVAVTREDYEALAGSYADPLFGRVAAAQAISSRSADSDLELQNRTLAISSALADARAPVDTAIAAATLKLAQITADLSTILSALTTTATTTSAAKITADTTIVSARSSKNRAQEIIADGNEILQQVTNGLANFAGVGAIVVGSPITTALSDAISAASTIFNFLSTLVTSSIQPSASTIQSASDAEIGSIGLIKDDLDTIGTDLTTVGSQMQIAQTARLDLESNAGTTPTTGLQGTLTTLSTAMVTLSSSVSDDITAINQHVDKLLSADCTANLVTVPILARDASGFYAAPSTSLIQSLQTNLDSRKEVTQTVQVTSGAQFLIPAVLILRVGILPGYSQQVMQKAVAAVVDAILRDRPFGKSLAESDITDPVVVLRGVDFVNTTIVGYYNPSTSVVVASDKLDANGNLIIQKTEVVTKGAVTVNIEQTTRIV